MLVWNYWKDVYVSGLQMASSTVSLVTGADEILHKNEAATLVACQDMVVESVAACIEESCPSCGLLTVLAEHECVCVDQRVAKHLAGLNLPDMQALAVNAPVQVPLASASSLDVKASRMMMEADVAGCRVLEDGRVAALTANWEMVTGLSAEDCDGEGFMMALHPYYRHAFMEKLDMLREGDSADAQAGIFSARMRCQIADVVGGWRWFDMKLYPAHDAPESHTCEMLLWDVHEQVMVERELRTAQIQAELAQRGRYEFLGHMSHELRTPLNAMLGFAEMMERGVYGDITTPEYRDYLVSIRESGSLLLHRINDMIEIVSIEVGSAVVDEGHIQPIELMEAAMRLQRHDSFCRGVMMRIDGIVPRVVVRGDRPKLVRAIGNLISNALRFSQPESEVCLSARMDRDGRLSITVKDEGVGMSPAHLTRISESLAQRQCLFSQSPETLGVGLGLAVTKEFVMLHDGEIIVGSEKDIGTSVSLVLPASRVVSLEPPSMAVRRKQVVNS